MGPIEADAYGLNLEFLATCLSCTSAQAGHNSSGAEARGSRLAGESISEGQIPANGYSSGSLVMLPANPLLRLVVAGWDGATTADGSSSEAHTRSALVDAAPGDGGLAALTLADSRSEASARGASSHASGESNIAHAALGGGRIAVVTLHSEGSSDRAGRACIASVNGWEVMPSSRGNRITVLPVAEMAALHGDSTGAVVGSVSDGRSQRIVGVATTWVGDPPSDPQPMR